MTLSPLFVFLGVVFLFLAGVPLGLLLLRVLEHLRGRTFSLSGAERALAAPYLATALLFVAASLPAPLYGTWLVVGAWSVGSVAMAYLWIRERGASLRPAVRWILSGTGGAVLLLTAGLDALEVWATGTHPFPNSYDGSFQTLYVHLLVSNHTLAWTLQPYAAMGVVYPQGAAVWMSFPVLVLGWSVQSAPIVLPPFFLGLSPLAAYCLGRRLGFLDSLRGERWGLAFAAFFALVASWPRLFIGGSYDFVFCLPLFLLALGWVRPFLETGLRSWADVVCFGGLLGAITSLSLSLGEALVLVLLAFAVVFREPGTFRGWQTVARLATVLAIGVAFVVRSIAGIVAWYSYPAHVLSAVGSPPSVPIPGLPSPTLETYVGNLYPFVPFKWKISPLPVMSVEIAVLLALGILLACVWGLAPRGRLRTLLPGDLVLSAVTITLVWAAWTLLLVAGSGPASTASIFDSLASLYESSFLVFIGYELIALLPVILLLEWLTNRNSVGRFRTQVEGTETPTSPEPPTQKSKGRGSPPWAEVGVALLLATPFAIGAATTVTQVPSFLSGHLADYSNVTAADVAALEWVGANLPSCSVVVAAPGSAAMFLPLYATVHLDFPMMPLSVNGSYNLVVADLTSGTLNPSTEAALTYLGTTEVFVTGQTSVTYPPFDSQPLIDSSNFAEVFHAGDASIFTFLPIEGTSGCVPG